ncbi:TIR domain-containing protein [Aquiflexum sp. TKW24L]|uniref:TIR domain-containing protein n=1 Tax=Aquiflexum sp. TKW24L TaxID=2942212 RepID=UPI0020C11E9C|nr:TIR domain-containing protein [Aquiflexum sp. TKW24L]MCL6257473.1 TIR domain-containing protein [Aquiflexum sp. TKW24L]
MTKRNLFFSYHHRSDVSYLLDLRKKLVGYKVSDYGFKELDLGEESKYRISRRIQYRIWSSSVVVVLVGERTGNSAWVEWEIGYALRSIRAKGPQKRIFNPKGLIALLLPTENPTMPKILQDQIDSGYAVTLEWNDVDKKFSEAIEQAIENRGNVGLINHTIKPKIHPQGFLNRVFYFLLNKG